MGFLPLQIGICVLALADPAITTAVGNGRQGHGGDGSLATEATLNQPFDVGFDQAGRLYLADTFNHSVRRVDPKTGTITTVAGNGTKGFSGDGGPATKAQLNEPYGVVIDSQGNLYFADRINRRVRRVDGATGVITTVAGNGTKISSGDGGPGAEAGFVEPNGVALNPKQTLLYISDVGDQRIRVLDLATGRIGTFAGDGKRRFAGDGGPAASASIQGARAVEVAADGTVLILEREGNRLRAVDPKTGIISTKAGTGAKGYSGDGGPASKATFNGPKELAVDPQGNIFIVDTENHAIRRIDAQSGVITTVAGSGKRGGTGDQGPATSATLDRPHGVAVDTQGVIYIGDTNNHRIRKVGP